ncbi:unnamed protein product [Vitrella brassicaformis CCMP3155]|uniref:Uncharacterized protein n=2 Tax=Vitrella brassicaformis TaxID=1169539 RepID=A0A0G4H212_VITBC|nr:unnamed protein product [Vitrella brassicaformis CCMP3155]|eukprot:CEM37662.1 unnamed protein product [Vitrella brassicaformis CCMP3155]
MRSSGRREGIPDARMAYAPSPVTFTPPPNLDPLNRRPPYHAAAPPSPGDFEQMLQGHSPPRPHEEPPAPLDTEDQDPAIPHPAGAFLDDSLGLPGPHAAGGEMPGGRISVGRAPGEDQMRHDIDQSSASNQSPDPGARDRRAGTAPAAFAYPQLNGMGDEPHLADEYGQPFSPPPRSEAPSHYRTPARGPPEQSGSVKDGGTLFSSPEAAAAMERSVGRGVDLTPGEADAMSAAGGQGLPSSSRQPPGVAEDPSAPQSHDPASARGRAEGQEEWESFLNPRGVRAQQDSSNGDDDNDGNGNRDGEGEEGGDTPSRRPSRPPPEYSPGGLSVVGSPQPHERGHGGAGREGYSGRGGMLNHAGLGGVQSPEAAEASRVSSSLAPSPLPTSPPPPYTPGMASRRGANQTPINRGIGTDTPHPQPPAPAAAAAIPPRPTPSGQPQLQPPQLDEHVCEREHGRGRGIRVNGEGHATGLDMGAGMRHPLTRDSQDQRARDRMRQRGGEGDSDGVQQQMDIQEERQQGRGGEGAGRDVDMRPRNNASMREPMHKPSPLFRRGDPQPHPAAAAPSEAPRDDHSPPRPPTTHPADRTSSPGGKSRDSSDLGIGRLDGGKLKRRPTGGDRGHRPPSQEDQGDEHEETQRGAAPRRIAPTFVQSLKDRDRDQQRDRHTSRDRHRDRDGEQEEEDDDRPKSRPCSQDTLARMERIKLLSKRAGMYDDEDLGPPIERRRPEMKVDPELKFMGGEDVTEEEVRQANREADEEARQRELSQHIDRQLARRLREQAASSAPAAAAAAAAGGGGGQRHRERMLRDDRDRDAMRPPPSGQSSRISRQSSRKPPADADQEQTDQRQKKRSPEASPPPAAAAAAAAAIVPSVSPPPPAPRHLPPAADRLDEIDHDAAVHDATAEDDYDEDEHMAVGGAGGEGGEAPAGGPSSRGGREGSRGAGTSGGGRRRGSGGGDGGEGDGQGDGDGAGAQEQDDDDYDPGDAMDIDLGGPPAAAAAAAAGGMGGTGDGDGDGDGDEEPKAAEVQAGAQLVSQGVGSNNVVASRRREDDGDGDGDGDEDMRERRPTDNPFPLMMTQDRGVSPLTPPEQPPAPKKPRGRVYKHPHMGGNAGRQFPDYKKLTLAEIIGNHFDSRGARKSIPDRDGESNSKKKAMLAIAAVPSPPPPPPAAAAAAAAAAAIGDSGDRDDEVHERRYPKRVRFRPLKGWMNEHIEYRKRPGEDAMGFEAAYICPDETPEIHGGKAKKGRLQKADRPIKREESDEDQPAPAAAAAAAAAAGGGGGEKKRRKKRKRERERDRDRDEDEDDEDAPPERGIMRDLEGQPPELRTVVHRDDVHFVRLPDALNEQDDDEAGDRFQLAVSFERPEVFMCYMTFSPGDQKGFESSEDKWLLMQVVDGPDDDKTLLVTMGNREEYAGLDDWIRVPPGTTYSIKNISARDTFEVLLTLVNPDPNAEAAQAAQQDDNGGRQPAAASAAAAAAAGGS